MPRTRFRARLPEEGRHGRDGGDRAETGNGKGNSDDLAQTRALAERDDGKRDREHWLKGRDHGRESRRQTDIHRHKKNPELPDADEQTDGDNRPPAHVRPRNEEDRRESGQPESQSGEEKRRERLEADVDDDKVDCPTDGDDERQDRVAAQHQTGAATSFTRLQAWGRGARRLRLGSG
jgi:hypothetical protein